MKNNTIAWLGSLVLCCAPLCGGAQEQPSPAGSMPAQQEPVVTVVLATPQKTGTTGQAILSQRGNDVLVTVKVPNAQAGDVALYKGACGSAPAGKPDKVLGKLKSGALQTTVTGTTIAALAQRPTRIVIDQTPPLCGDVSAENPIPGSQQGTPASPMP